MFFKKIIFIVSILNLYTSYLKGQDQIKLCNNSPYKLGVSVNKGLFNNQNYKVKIDSEYNSITIENDLKFPLIHPSNNQYNWILSDSIINYAQNNGKRIHGHTLVWYPVPQWVNNFIGDSAAWEKILKGHIKTVIGHYKGIITSWDVVNEAIDDNGKLINTIWKQHLGDNYIERCFNYAHEADSSALLFYNDYQTSSLLKDRAIYSLLKNLITKGVPIHGVGLQMHIDKDFNNQLIKRLIDMMVTTGLKIHISELDVALNKNNLKPFYYNNTLANQQFEKYKFITRYYKSMPLNQQYGITFWNVSDKDSWLVTYLKHIDYPLPFDTNYNKKWAYYGVIDGAGKSWNFGLSNLFSLSGNYVDLGSYGKMINKNTNGKLISYDNDNSDIQDIGFNFNYNGTNYSQFILNTNGFIKFGASPVSCDSIFYRGDNSFCDGVLKASDIDLLYPFNSSLTKGILTPEFRVYTSGTKGSRVCTIQFKNLADKASIPQYKNIEFQIKLYENNSSIEFIYGNWIPTTNITNTIKSYIGIKGVDLSESINLFKESSCNWNAILPSSCINFELGGVSKNNNLFLSKNTFLPDFGRTFLFMPSKAIIILPNSIWFDLDYNQDFVTIKYNFNLSSVNSYQIEKSTNGIDFQILSHQIVNGYNTNNQNLSYTENNFKINGINKYYYRLKTIDTNGRVNYSEIKSIDLYSNKTSLLNVSLNNPFSDVINLEVSKMKSPKLEISLYDILGRKVLDQNFQIPNVSITSTIQISSFRLLRNCYYILKIKCGVDELQYKVLKK